MIKQRYQIPRRSSLSQVSYKSQYLNSTNRIRLPSLSYPSMQTSFHEFQISEYNRDPNENEMNDNILKMEAEIKKLIEFNADPYTEEFDILVTRKVQVCIEIRSKAYYYKKFEPERKMFLNDLELVYQNKKLVRTLSSNCHKCMKDYLKNIIEKPFQYEVRPKMLNCEVSANVKEWNLLFAASMSFITLNFAEELLPNSFCMSIIDNFTNQNPTIRAMLAQLVVSFYINFSKSRVIIQNKLKNYIIGHMHYSLPFEVISPTLSCIATLYQKYGYEFDIESIFIDIGLCLVTSPFFYMFSEEYRACCLLAIKSGPELSCKLFDYLLFSLYKAYSNKHCSLIEMALSSLAQMPSKEFSKRKLQIERFFKVCILNQNEKIFETFIQVFDEPHMKGRLYEFSKFIFPIMKESLEISESRHWSPKVHSLAKDALDQMKSIDKNLFITLDKQRMRLKEKKRSKEELWMDISRMALANQSDVNSFDAYNILKSFRYDTIPVTRRSSM